MSLVRIVTATIMTFVLLAAPKPAQDVWPVGTHRLVLDCPGGPLPFGVTLDAMSGSLAGWLHNGKERIRIPSVKWDVDDLVLSFPHYASRIELKVDHAKKRLSGIWSKVRGEGKVATMKVASVPLKTRFAVDARDVDPSWVDGRWSVKFASSDDPAVGIFKSSREQPYECEGTFLTTLGDYRYLAGNVDGDVMRLSCFDGAHAFLFHARRLPGLRMAGDFWSSANWHEGWTARRDDEASLPDGWKLTKWTDEADLDGARFKDLKGELRSLNDAEFRGKARIIEVFGSWCPNCHDHGAYMADLHRRYGPKGLKILGLAFEHTTDHERSVRQVEIFRRRHGATFPVLVAGLSDKKAATRALALLDRVRSYPTTIFIDGNDRVRGVYQGFSGPATGEAHRVLRARFEDLIERMLAGK